MNAQRSLPVLLAGSLFLSDFYRHPAPQAPQRLTRFTRLAGLFMGTTDAATVGSFRLRFVLDIR